MGLTRARTLSALLLQTLLLIKRKYDRKVLRTRDAYRWPTQYNTPMLQWQRVARPAHICERIIPKTMVLYKKLFPCQPDNLDKIVPLTFFTLCLSLALLLARSPVSFRCCYRCAAVGNITKTFTRKCVEIAHENNFSTRDQNEWDLMGKWMRDFGHTRTHARTLRERLT